MNGTLIWETESEAQSVRGRKQRELPITCVIFSEIGDSLRL